MNVHDRPFGFGILTSEGRLDGFDNRLERRLSELKGQFSDEAAYQRLLQQSDPIVYEVYEIRRPERAGELLPGLSVVHPGRVGEEYFMTKGHFHSVRDTAEVYLCLKGLGLLLMETEDGEWAAEELVPGVVVYVPPYWAHRSINVGESEDFVTLFVYPGHAGHDYGTIKRRLFRKRVLWGEEGFRVVDNPTCSVADGGK
jgi:glucose-6-phosphate isomerase